MDSCGTDTFDPTQTNENGLTIDEILLQFHGLHLDEALSLGRSWDADPQPNYDGDLEELFHKLDLNMVGLNLFHLTLCDIMILHIYQ